MERNQSGCRSKEPHDYDVDVPETSTAINRNIKERLAKTSPIMESLRDSKYRPSTSEEKGKTLKLCPGKLKLEAGITCTTGHDTIKESLLREQITREERASNIMKMMVLSYYHLWPPKKKNDTQNSPVQINATHLENRHSQSAKSKLEVVIPEGGLSTSIKIHTGNQHNRQNLRCFKDTSTIPYALSDRSPESIQRVEPTTVKSNKDDYVTNYVQSQIKYPIYRTLYHDNKLSKSSISKISYSEDNSSPTSINHLECAPSTTFTNVLEVEGDVLKSISEQTLNGNDSQWSLARDVSSSEVSVSLVNSLKSTSSPRIKKAASNTLTHIIKFPKMCHTNASQFPLDKSQAEDNSSPTSINHLECAPSKTFTNVLEVEGDVLKSISEQTLNGNDSQWSLALDVSSSEVAISLVNS